MTLHVIRTFFVIILLLPLSYKSAIGQSVPGWEPGTPAYKTQKFKIHEVVGKRSWLRDLESVFDSKTGKELKKIPGIKGSAKEIEDVLTELIEHEKPNTLVKYINFYYPKGFVPCKIKIWRRALNGPGHVGLRVWEDNLGAYIALKRNHASDFLNGKNVINIDIEVKSIYWRDYRDTGNGKAAWQDGTCDYRVYHDMPESATKVIFNQSFD